MKNPKLREFVEEVNRKIKVPAVKRSDTFLINKERAVAAAGFIENRLDALSRAGKSSKGKAGPKIKKHDPKSVANRERVRKQRELADKSSVLK